MGLKLIEAAGPKNGKTVLAVGAAQLGPVGYIDNEYHARPYLLPHPTIKPSFFPFHKPMRTNPDMPMGKANPSVGEAFATTNVVYLVESMEFGEQVAALQAFSESAEIVTLVTDSGSVVWDLLGDIADKVHEDSAAKNLAKGKAEESTMGRLAWTKPKKYLRRYFYNMLRSGRHIIVTSHMQENWKEVDGKLVMVGVKPWLEKKSAHWADLIVEMLLPPAKPGEPPPVPSLMVMGDNLGGLGGLSKGAIVKNPTFKMLVDKTGLGDVQSLPLISDEELAHRNESAVERVVQQSTGLTNAQEERATYPHS